MKALKDLKDCLRLVQNAQMFCVDDSGYIKSQYRYDYQRYTRKAKSYKDAIDTLEALMTEN